MTQPDEDGYVQLETAEEIATALDAGAAWATKQGGYYVRTSAPLQRLEKELRDGTRAFISGCEWSEAAPWSTAVILAEKQFSVDVSAC